MNAMEPSFLLQTTLEPFPIGWIFQLYAQLFFNALVAHPFVVCVKAARHFDHLGVFKK